MSREFGLDKIWIRRFEYAYMLKPVWWKRKFLALSENRKKTEGGKMRPMNAGRNSDIYVKKYHNEISLYYEFEG